MPDPSFERLVAQFSAQSGPKFFETMYKMAELVEKAEKSGDPEKLKGIGYGTMATCQVRAWKQPKYPGTPVHKDLCQRNKEHMKRIPYFRGEIFQFPWGRLGPDGTCNHNLIKARLKVLGSGASAGYWSIPGGLQPHDYSAATPQGMPRAEGTCLNVELWKLAKVEQVPKLFFDDDAPARPQPGQIKDWKSWYAWRGLPLESPAALLMDSPLSVYHLLVDVLKLVPSGGSATQHRLNVHFIGAEAELNFVPLFSELALLLPNTHIDLTMFGKAAYDLVRMARKTKAGSVAAKDTVWSYTAPKVVGGGSIDVRLHAEGENWSRTVVENEVTGEVTMPDALIGLNAGLISYSTWQEPLMCSHHLDIPFAVTDYCEQTMDATAHALPIMFADIDAQIAANAPHMAAGPKKRECPNAKLLQRVFHEGNREDMKRR
ncbi:hypothetical protein EWM64_g10345 [Hericium alpestre]|uniref:Mitochondrial splicing suppressor 51-like C-terminal domain-containing protein n=1 Tax=Hericium alpestre TaxID=135208 RepID=A0A4Y9ZI34_9AGAM|nr:hypothetical protein EWM64_g10345 [Hericium alpestre]